jgi:hypothetical protein
VYQVNLIFFSRLESGQDLEKAGSKKGGHCYSKREEVAWSCLFLNKNGPVFTLLFSGPHFGNDFFFKVTNRPIFSKQE